MLKGEAYGRTSNPPAKRWIAPRFNRHQALCSHSSVDPSVPTVTKTDPLSAARVGTEGRSACLFPCVWLRSDRRGQRWQDYSEVWKKRTSYGCAGFNDTRSG